MTIDDKTLKIEMKALEILKVCRERGQKRAGGISLDEAIAELEALQQRSCESCKYGIAYLGSDRKWCEANIQQDGMTTVDKDFCCNRYEPKGK